MSNEHKKLPTFGKRPLMPVGDGAPEGTRCLQLLIPDSDLAVRQMLGALRLLTFWRSYERDPAHPALDWAKAWTAALAETLGGSECMSRTQLRVDAICQLSWSYDDWVTFDSFDPTACIEALLDSEFGTRFNDMLQDKFDDGTLQRGTGQQSPQSPPTSGQCSTFHVHLEANGKWHCPVPVSDDFTIAISNATGGWCDGGVYWYCPTGDSYGLGICSLNTGHLDAGDPIPTIYHMRIVGKLGSGAYFDPETSTYTVPVGTGSVDFTLQANDGSLSDNLGSVDFDVTVCNGSTLWSHLFDFSTSACGFYVPAGQLGAYGGAAPAHWGGQNSGIGAVCGIRRDWVGARKIHTVQVNMALQDSRAGEPIFILYLSGAQVARWDGTTSAGQNIGTPTTGVNYSYNFGGVNCDSVLVQIATRSDGSTCNQYNVVFTGEGTDPF